MKLRDLLETPFKATEQFRDYTPGQIEPIVASFKLAKSVFKFENDKFELKELGNETNKIFGLIRTEDDQLLGWIKMHKDVHNNKPYLNFDIIYVLPQFRKPNVIALLLKGVRAETDLPWWIDGAVFAGGERIVKLISKLPMFDIKTVVTKTGEEREFKHEDTFDSQVSLVIEDVGNRGTGWLFEYYLFPWSDVKTYTTVHEEFHDVDL